MFSICVCIDDRQIDLWSICVSLYELFTGHVMFPGRTNNEMLKLMMGVKGKFPNKLLKNHFRSYEMLQLEPHFDSDLRFRQHELDAVTGKPVMKLVEITQPTKDLSIIMRSSKVIFCTCFEYIGLNMIFTFMLGWS
jgi:serine/threonine-protein kinase PRP4